MGLETFNGIDDLVATNPVDTTDTVASMAAHIRGMKSTLQTDFPAIAGPVTATHTELNILDGVTASATQINQLNGKGALISDGFATAAGTANVITADFTTNISLTDNTTVVVEAGFKNTSDVVTFNPDSLGAKSVKIAGNQSLKPGMIRGAGHRLILTYDSGNDVWELLNPYYVLENFALNYSVKNRPFLSTSSGANGVYPTAFSTSGGGGVTGQSNGGVSVTNGATTSGNKGAAQNNLNSGSSDSRTFSFASNYIRWQTRISSVSIAVSMSACAARFYVGSTSTSNEGFGFLVNTSGQWVGEANNTGRNTTALTGTPTAASGDIIEARLYPGVKIEYYLNGTLVGTNSTVAQLPDATVFSIECTAEVENTGTASGVNTFVCDPYDIEMIDVS